MRRVTAALAALSLALLAAPAGAQGVVAPPGLTPGAAVSSPDWTQQPADGDKAPAVGGRIHQRFRVARAAAVLASFDQVSRLATAPAEASDVASTSLYGDTRLTFTATSTTARDLVPATALATPVNVTGGLIRFWVKPIANVKDRLATFSIRLHSAGTPASPGANYVNFSGAAAVREFANNAELRWASFTVPVSSFTTVGTGADLTAIAFARITIASSSTATPLTLAVGNIELVPNGLTKAKMIIGFDDNYPATIAYASRALGRYGFPGVLYPSNSLAQIDQANKLTSAGLKNLHDNLGWQIASQAWSTEAATGVGGIDTMTADQRTAEMARLRNFQNALGLTGGGHGSYFSNVGPTDMTAWPMFRQHFHSMRGYYFGDFAYTETYPWGDPMRIRAQGAGEFQYSSDPDLFTNHWKKLIDQAIAQKGVGFLVFHGGLDTAGVSWQSSFDAMAAYLNANRAAIDVATVEDLETP